MTASWTARGLEPSVAVLKNAWSAGMVNWVRSACQKASSSRTPMSAGMQGAGFAARRQCRGAES